VLHDETGAFVWVADQSERVARKTGVTTGTIGARGLVEVTQGLAAGSRIISRGYESLRDGMRIHVIDEDHAQLTNVAATHADQPLDRLPQGE
jgi:hypothetical protein